MKKHCTDTIALILLAVATVASGQTTKPVPTRVNIDSKPFLYVSPKLEKGTYLGLATTAAPASLREQLKLKPGLGLVVEKVEKDSPADLAGVKKYDLLQRLDDQWLVNPEQLAVLVRTREPDSQVTLSLIRQGEPQVVTAKLVQKEVPSFSLKSDNANNVSYTLEGGAPLLGATFVNGGSLVKMDGNQADIISDWGDQKLALSRKNGDTHLKATDGQGNVLFDGPINTDEQMASIPADLQLRVKQLLAGIKAARLRVETKTPVEP